LNNEKKTKPSIIIAAATVAVVIVSAAMILGIQIQTYHNVLAQSTKSNATTTTTTAANTVVTVTPSQSTNKTFWISTVHLDGPTSLQAYKLV